MKYARSKVDYVTGEFVCMLPCSMNLWIGKVKNYNNKILISSPSFKIRTNLKINLDDEKDKPDAKSKREGTVRTKPNIDSNNQHKQGIKRIKIKPSIEFRKEDKLDTNKITYEEEKVALILGMTSIFTVWWVFK